MNPHISVLLLKSVIGNNSVSPSKSKADWKGRNDGIFPNYGMGKGPGNLAV